MTQDELARSYFEKARKRKRVLEVLLEDEAYSDVVRKAQPRHTYAATPNGLTRTQ